MKSNQFRCPRCGAETKKVAAGPYCYKCDILLDSAGQLVATKTEEDTAHIAKRPAPPVEESDVWVPILWLVGMIFLGVVSWILGLLGLIGATIYVYYNAKKFGIGGGGYAVITLLLAIIGLPVYAYELHKLRKNQQTGQVGTLVQPTVPTTTPSVAQQAPATSPPTKFCRACGAKIPRDSIYCEECGTSLA